MKELNDRLRQLDNEDFIWIIYVGIIVLSFYSNFLERRYFVFGDLKCKDRYRRVMILIFSILIVVYLYFLKDAWDSVKNLSCSDSLKKRRLVYLSFIGSLLIAISGFIFLFIVFFDKDINVEIAFN
jgi:hypothetical protein